MTFDLLLHGPARAGRAPVAEHTPLIVPVDAEPTRLDRASVVAYVAMLVLVCGFFAAVGGTALL